MSERKMAKTIHRLEVERGGMVSIEGDVAAGSVIPLSWAADSAVACFPATRFDEFRGPHMFYGLDLPRQTLLQASLEPLGSGRINLYGFSGHDGVSTPPDVARVVSCEASYPIYAGTTDLTASAGQRSLELVAINNPYRVLLAVAGARGTTRGTFRLEVHLQPR